MRALYLVDEDKKLMRSVVYAKPTGVVVYRKDTKRVEFLDSTDRLSKKKIPFQLIQNVNMNDVAAGQDLHIPGIGMLVSQKPQESNTDFVVAVENQQSWKSIMLVLLVSSTALLVVLQRYSPKEEVSLTEAIIQREVKIVPKEDLPKPEVKKEVVAQAPLGTGPGGGTRGNGGKGNGVGTSVRRMGALAVLGESTHRNGQLGGISVGAVHTTAGPGLGGTMGSGGVQTSLYGKGIIYAPLGAGNNMQGEGGYGTRGKGGGQAGYGQLTLIGSVGTSTLPTGRETIVPGGEGTSIGGRGYGTGGGAGNGFGGPNGSGQVLEGLDQGLIDTVVKKNMGQIRFCYEQGLQLEPKLSGRVAVNFIIGAQGQVTLTSLNHTTLNSKMVEDCIMLRLKTWKFPAPQGGKEVSVTYPFVLKRVGAG